MASAKAIARIDCTRIGVAAPGLRPTASEAFMPMKPTPSAAPSAARPTVRFPLSSANIGVIIYVPFLLLSPSAPAIEHGQTAEISFKSMVRLFVALVMRHDQHREHRR